VRYGDKSVVVDTHTGVTSYIDDEYQLAGVDDPRILITTSRNPSARLKQFAKVCHLVGIVCQRAVLLQHCCRLPTVLQRDQS